MPIFVRTFVLAVLSLWSTAIASGQQTPSHEIYRLSDVYHKSLFQPYTWIFLDIDETLITQKQSLDPYFINIVKTILIRTQLKILLQQSSLS